MNSDHQNAGRPFIAVGAAMAGLSIVLGAFGVHALKSRIGPEALGWWQNAGQYLMWQGLAVLVLGLAGLKWTRIPALLLAGGVLVFSVTLYAMALGAPHWLGAITPLGGIAMIAGWALLAWRAAFQRRS